MLTHVNETRVEISKTKKDGENSRDENIENHQRDYIQRQNKKQDN